MLLVNINRITLHCEYNKIKILSVGIEPTTLGLLDPRSNQLSYESCLLLLWASRKSKYYLCY